MARFLVKQQVIICFNRSSIDVAPDILKVSCGVAHSLVFGPIWFLFHWYLCKKDQMVEKCHICRWQNVFFGKRWKRNEMSEGWAMWRYGWTRENVYRLIFSSSSRQLLTSFTSCYTFNRAKSQISTNRHGEATQRILEGNYDQTTTFFTWYRRNTDRLKTYNW